MGAGNAGKVVLIWSAYLPDLPFRVAVQMALTAHDEHDPPCYWHGWAPLAAAAGKTFDEACGLPRSGCRGCSGCAAARKTVERALAVLKAVGLVEQIEAPRLGWNAKYALRFDAPRHDGMRVNRSRGADRLQPFPRGESHDAQRRAAETTRTTLSVVQTPDAERRADARRSASEMHDAERRADYKELHQQEYPQEDAASTGSTSPRALDATGRFRCCRWRPEDGHKPGCRGARTA